LLYAASHNQPVVNTNAMIAPKAHVGNSSGLSLFVETALVEFLSSSAVFVFEFDPLLLSCVSVVFCQFVVCESFSSIFVDPNFEDISKISCCTHLTTACQFHFFTSHFVLSRNFSVYSLVASSCSFQSRITWQ